MRLKVNSHLIADAALIVPTQTNGQSITLTEHHLRELWMYLNQSKSLLLDTFPAQRSDDDRYANYSGSVLSDVYVPVRHREIIQCR